MPGRHIPWSFQGATVAFTGTASLSVAQPSFAASGTVTNPAITGTASLAVTQPSIAATGKLKYSGTAALVVPQPGISATGFNSSAPAAPPAVGGRPHRRAVVHRYPERRAPRVPKDAHPLYGQLVPVFEGEALLTVRPPRFRASGLVELVGAKEDDRIMYQLALEDDEDLALALSLADTWLT